MTANPTLGELLRTGAGRLSASPAAGRGTPGLDAEVLLAHVSGLPRARLRSHPETAVDAAAAERFLELIGRRAAGEPLAYLVGHKEFWSLELAVNPAVLIPRPETELLVERALKLGAAQEIRVADLGTGSGAIALALAGERPTWQVVATDLSEAALAVARANAQALGLSRVEFRRGSWFEPLGAGRFELILCNPPYVDAQDPALEDPALRHEPRLALTPGPDGLACLTALARGAAPHLSAGGWLLLEHGAAQAARVRAELVGAGFAHVRSHRDLAGHERMTEGQR